MNHNAPCAQATADGHLEWLSRDSEPHPRYELEAFRAHVRIPLGPGQRQVLEDIQAGAGEVRYSIRSALAQPGIDGFDPESTQILKFDQTSALVTTLLTDWRQQTGSTILGILRTLAARKLQPRIVRQVLLPHAARIPAQETVLRPAGTDEWTLALPLAREEYRILDATITERSISEMLFNGSARKHLEKIRHRSPDLPEAIPGGEFFLGGVEAPVLPYHLVLRQHTQAADGSETAVMHGHSCLFDAGRAHRQLEMLNTGKQPVPLGGLNVLAYAYRATNPAE